jgi:hypothetical protein
MFRNLFILILLLSQTSCAIVTLDDEPIWWKNKSQFTGGLGWCGSGVGEFRGNRDLAETAARLSAAESLAEQLKRNLQSIVNKTANSISLTYNKFGFSSSQELITKFTESVVSQSLTMTREVKFERVGNTFYAMVCVDTDYLIDNNEILKTAQNNPDQALPPAVEAQKQITQQKEKLNQFLKQYENVMPGR